MAPSIPTHAEAWQIHANATSHDEYDASILQNLVLAKDHPVAPQQQPGPRQVLVRMRAAALNFRDLLIIADSPNYPVRNFGGLIPCSDGAGEVVAVGDGSVWGVGAKVMLMPNQSWIDGDITNFRIDAALSSGEIQGTLSQYRVVDDRWVIRMPEGLSWEEAASLPTAGGTAVQALFHSGITADAENPLDLSGKTVLIQGTGGVSVFAIQLAKAAGARVIATSSSKEKLQIAERLGATDLIDYKATPEWADEVLKVTGGKGVDLVVEVGGAGTIEQSLKSTRFGGTVVVIGILTASQKADLIPAILFGGKIVRGHLGTSAVMLDQLTEMIEKHTIRPVVGKVFEWEAAPHAFEHMMRQGVVGKIVVTI